MGASLQAQIKATVMPTLAFTLRRPGLPQRACACGGSPGADGGECAACRNKRLRVQRQAANGVVSPLPYQGRGAGRLGLVHDVLRSPGQPLDTPTRAYMEPRLGYDFSRVRVHTDTRAAESAQAVNALAYTVGRDVVFGAGQYAPGTPAGRQLLAHELAHVVQQGSESRLHSKLELGAVNDRFEQEASSVATQALIPESAICQAPLRPQVQRQGIIQRSAIYTGRILNEGGCEFLACNDKYACKDADGFACPKDTPHAGEKYVPSFACKECKKDCNSDDHWITLPHKQWARRKCNQDLVVCANHAFTHGTVLDRSDKEAWEVSPGILTALGVEFSSTAKRTTGDITNGAVYGDETDPDFLKDPRCQPETKK
jgi:hypothetical protein